MSAITIKIGNEVRLPAPPLDVYILTLTFMSGDGDVYDTEEMRYSCEADLQYALEYIVAYENVDWNARCDFRNTRDLCNGIGVTEPDYRRKDLSDQECVLSDLLNCWGYDKFSDGDRLAMLTEFKVYYYDIDGRKFDVTVSVK